jgi:hypothetical protein
VLHGKYYYDDEIEEDEMSGASSTDGSDEKYVQIDMASHKYVLFYTHGAENV